MVSMLSLQYKVLIISIVLQSLLLLSHGFVKTSFLRKIIFRHDKARTDSSVTSSAANHLEYPHVFTGRLWFSPALVPVPTQVPHHNVNFLSFFGYTLGGYVVLEYDESPVGPYFEFVSMSSLVIAPSSMFQMGVGQWGSRLYVSNPKAEQLCKQIWGVPAECANIQIQNRGDRLGIHQYPNSTAELLHTQDIIVQGWNKTRRNRTSEINNKRIGPLHINWTPTIKALWISLLDRTPGQDILQRELNHGLDHLPIHRLRLSAESIKINIDWTRHPGDNVIPLGLQLLVDNVMIEISQLKGVL